ncbi:MAG: YgiT-type zinc finger protein [Lentisphaerae bacterium]|nr:YgiT-type zinc finger protein [Lentisphaerota bacterium]
MKKCDVCGNTVFHQEYMDEFFRFGGDTVLVEQVPAQVCDRCGEVTFGLETVEKVRKMVQEHSQPTRKIEVETFAFA